MSDAEPVEAAIDELYSARPADFLSRRKTLSARLRSAGDGAGAKRVQSLRKPTLAAAIVNIEMHRDGAGIERLVDVGDRLRAAHADLDAAVIRELSAERRRLVAEIADAAVENSGLSASPAVRGDVVNTLDAAVADPDVAARLGRLTTAEHWSGFGVVADSPALRVLPGGRGERVARQRPASSGATTGGATRAGAIQRGTADPPPASGRPKLDRATRQLRRDLEQARDALDAADRDLASAQQDDDAAREQVRELSTELSELQQRLNAAKAQVTGVHRELRAAKARRREARSALDRAQRRADADPS